jgi:predicted nuclease of predicted toxin-antitoxin system
MKILIDENIPTVTAQELRAAGHDVRDIRSTSVQGIADEDLWQVAQDDERLLITTDKGFAQHRAEPHHGVLIVRLRQPNRHKIHQHILRAIAQFSGEDWMGLTVVTRDAVQSSWRASAK